MPNSYQILPNIMENEIRDIKNNMVFDGDEVRNFNVGLRGIMKYDLKEDCWYFYDDKGGYCGVPEKLACNKQFGIVKIFPRLRKKQADNITPNVPV